MKKISVTILGLCVCLVVSAQMINNGTTMVIESNSSLIIEGDFSNINAGIITVLGTLDVGGNLTNLATLNAEANSTIRFSGTSTSAFTSGNAPIYHLEINKSGDATVNLADDLTVTNELEFTSGKVILGDHNLHLGASTLISNPGSDAYIATNGIGSVLKEVNGNGMVFMPIGDANNYSPLTMQVEGTGFALAQIKTRVVSSTHPEKPLDAESYIKRYWEVESSGISGYSNEWTGNYVSSDVEGNVALIKGAVYNGMQWDYFDAGGSTNTVTGSTVEGLADLTGTNFYGRADILVFLQGAYNSSTGMMTTTLNSMGLIPLSSPYADAPVTVSSIPADVTDWIKLEMRSTTDPSQVLGRVSALLRNDGAIISATGDPLPQVKDSEGSSIVSVHHRNHLPVRTETGLNTMTPVQHDFSVSGNFFGSNAQRSNSGLFAMWPGNSNNDHQIKYSGSNNDTDVVLNTILSHPSNLFNSITFSFTSYSNLDVNLDGIVKYSGSNNDADLILNNILVHPSNSFNSLTFSINQQF